MRYVHGSLAEQLENEGAASQRAGRASRPSLSVLPSAKPRQHAEAYLSPLAVSILKAVVALGVCAAVACVARIAVITVCFSVSAQNNALVNQIDEARATGDELEVQQSVYGNSERVRSIATDVYGMVPAASVTTVSAAQASGQEQASQASE